MIATTGEQPEQVHHRPAGLERRHEQVQRGQRGPDGEIRRPQRRPAAHAMSAWKPGSSTERSSPAAASSSSTSTSRSTSATVLAAVELDPEADLVARHERVGGDRGVDAAVEQQPADRVDAPVIADGDLDDREAAAVGRGHAEAVECVQHARREVVQRRSQRVAAALVDVEAGERGRQRGDGRRAGVQVRAARPPSAAA